MVRPVRGPVAVRTEKLLIVESAIVQDPVAPVQLNVKELIPMFPGTGVKFAAFKGVEAAQKSQATRRQPFRYLIIVQKHAILIV